MQVRSAAYGCIAFIGTIGLDLPIFQGVDTSANPRHWPHIIITRPYAVGNT